MIKNRPACNNRRGVTIHLAEACSPGNTLYWGMKKGQANLIDMDGTNVHQWTYGGNSIWHHADMLPNGNLLRLINDGTGYGSEVNHHRSLVELHWNSNLVWSDPVHRHHDVRRLAKGNTLVCAMNWEETGRIIEVIPAKEIVWELWGSEGQALYRAARYLPDQVEPRLGFRGTKG